MELGDDPRKDDLRLLASLVGLANRDCYSVACGVWESMAYSHFIGSRTSISIRISEKYYFRLRSDANEPTVLSIPTRL